MKPQRTMRAQEQLMIRLSWVLIACVTVGGAATAQRWHSLMRGSRPSRCLQNTPEHTTCVFLPGSWFHPSNPRCPPLTDEGLRWRRNAHQAAALDTLTNQP